MAIKASSERSITIHLSLGEDEAIMLKNMFQNIPPEWKEIEGVESLAEGIFSSIKNEMDNISNSLKIEV